MPATFSSGPQGPGAGPEPVRLDQEHRAEHDRGRDVHEAGVGHRPQQQGRGDRRPGVEHDLAADHGRGRDHRQHRHVHAGVVVAVAQGQGPRVRRGPEEHHHEEHHRRPGELAGDRGPADERREAAGQPAPDDVLGGPALEPDRVDEQVERLRDQGQPGGQDVDPDGQDHRRQHTQGDPEDGGRHRRDDVPRQRASPRPAHLLVDVAVVDAVERRGRARRQGAADDRGGHQTEAGHPTLGEEHHRHGGEQQELDDPGLGEPDVGHHDVAEPGPLGRRRRGRSRGPLTDVGHGRPLSSGSVSGLLGRWDFGY